VRVKSRGWDGGEKGWEGKDKRKGRRDGAIGGGVKTGGIRGVGRERGRVMKGGETEGLRGEETGERGQRGGMGKQRREGR